MEQIIEYIKIGGAILGPLLGAIALLIQRFNENKQINTSSDVSFSAESRQWASDFRTEMKTLRDETKQAQSEALACRQKLLETEKRMNTLTDQVEDLSEENTQLKEQLAILRTENLTLQTRIQLLQKEKNDLQLTVEKQARQIKQLETKGS